MPPTPFPKIQYPHQFQICFGFSYLALVNPYKYKKVFAKLTSKKFFKKKNQLMFLNKDRQYRTNVLNIRFQVLIKLEALFSIADKKKLIFYSETVDIGKLCQFKMCCVYKAQNWEQRSICLFFNFFFIMRMPENLFINIKYKYVYFIHIFI